MPIHEEVLRTARRLCLERGGWTFTPGEVVRALPHLNERSVRTHIVSRCCVNAPRHHPHKWDYFRRLRRGHYELLPQYRRDRKASRLKPLKLSLSVAETATRYGSSSSSVLLRDSVHVTVTRGENAYIAECLEIAVVTQGVTLDELIFNLREAINLHLEGEDAKTLGLVPRPRLVIVCDLPLQHVSQA